MACLGVKAQSYRLYADEITTMKGSQCELKVKMSNPKAVTLWQVDLVLPKGFTVATDSWGDPAIAISGGRTTATRHSIASNQLPDGSVRIICASSSNYNFTGSDGEVATITLNVDDKVGNGTYDVLFNNILLVETNETAHRVWQVTSSIVVKNYRLGDVNDDGTVNGMDLVGLINFILGRPAEGDVFEAADVVADGVIDGKDYVREVNAILGRETLE